MRSADHWHVPALDGLRGIAVLVVLMCHAPAEFRLVGGNIGVDLFFVLSGFLITSILLNEWRDRETISVRHFYYRRILRLLPASFSVLLFAMIAARFIQPPEQLRAWVWDALSVIFYGFNWRLVWLYSDDTGYFHNHMLSHFWSLSVEEQFYLIWPALLLTLLRSKASKPLMIAIFATGILAPTIARIMLRHDGPSLDLYFRSDLRLDGLVWGSALAWLVHNDMILAGSRLRRFADLAGFTALCAFLYTSQYELLSDGSLYRWGFSLVGLLSALMICCAVSAPETIFARCLSMGWLRWTGRISYGLYLWHVPIFAMSVLLPFGEGLRLAIAVLSTFSVAAISFEFFEMRFLRIKQKIGYARAAEMPGADVSVAAAPQ